MVTISEYEKENLTKITNMTAKDLWLKDLDNEFNDHQQSHNNNTEKHRIYDDDDNDDHQIKHQQVKLEEEH
ncbi:1761_t:CDS:2 [Entrophospora sp. SA101]|nr:1761_t:CDS:2 [Entrophospora sp. SA101]